MSKTYEVSIDRTKSLTIQPNTGHNRWHPDIEPILRIDPGDEVIMDTRDALDGLITPNSSGADVPHIELTRAHPLTGPVFISDSNPGDVLEVNILEIEPDSSGYTMLLPGSGLLKEYFPEPYLTHWEIRGKFASSPQIDRVRIPGQPFMGVLGVAPSHQLLDSITTNERRLAEQGVKVALPSEKNAIPATSPVSTNGLRTIPPNRNGGNLDVKQLKKGSTLFLPVLTEGALFSAGDAHFAQGDGESCGTAIEVAARLHVKFKVHKNAKGSLKPRPLHFEYSDDLSIDRQNRKYHATMGISTRLDGSIESGNLTLASQNALLSMIDYLVADHRLTREQAYILTSVAVDLRISQIVNHPNVLVSAFLPLDIFSTYD
jgi:formamidase